jgi:hypothetical protein
VYAYENYNWAAYLLKQMIARNGVRERVQVGGTITPPELERRLAKSTSPAVVCDVEGYEMELMDPTTVPSLARATMLLELHESLVPGVTEEMRRRFSGTHRIDEFHDRPRTLADLPSGVSLAKEDALWAIDEARFRCTRQSWFYLEPWKSAAQRKAA